MKIGHLLYLYRVTNKISTREMGEQLGISASSVSRIERGHAPDGQTMLSLMNWLFTEDSHGKGDGGMA